MRKISSLLFTFLILACSNKQESSSQTNTLTIPLPLKENPGFDLRLNLEDTEDGKKVLLAELDLDSGVFIVSPYSTDDVYGHFQLKIDENPYLKEIGEILERPSSIEAMDKDLQVPVRFVLQNTSYQQKLEILTEGDFETKGSIWFVYEPECLPYEMKFTLSHLSGKLHIRNVKEIFGSRD